MANRRMFSKTITNSSKFLMMPPTSRLLYYDLGMNSDDDGFCEHYAIMKMTEASPDDLRILEARKFVKIFDDKVLIVLDWRENNYIQSDRYSPSRYLQLYQEEIKLLALNNNQIENNNVCIQNVYNMDTQDRLGKDRLELGKDKIINKYICARKQEKKDTSCSQNEHSSKNVTQELKDTFLEFWNFYPKKKSKGSAYKAWQKIKPDIVLRQKIKVAIEKYKKSDDWLKENGKYIPYPATFLNGGCWEDEIIINESPIEKLWKSAK